MGSGRQLTDEERAQIDILRRTHPDWTQKKIALTIGRSPNLIGRYLKDPEHHGRKKRSGRPKITTEREDRLIALRAENDKMSANQVKNDLNLSCSSRTVLRRLTSNPNLRYGIHKSKPKLDSNAKSKRLTFATEHITMTDSDWSNIIWTDEKV